MRSIVFFAVLLCWLAAASLARAEEPALAGYRPDPSSPDYQLAPSGRRFRGRFDPVSRVWLGGGPALTRDHDRVLSVTPEFNLGLSYRSLFVSGLGHDKVVWQVDHRVLNGWARPFRRDVSGMPSFDATLYRATLLRHDQSPAVVLPFSPPLSVPFPFDIGFETEIGRVQAPSFQPVAPGTGALLPMLRVGVIQAAFLIDPWRTGRTGQSVEVGIGARYDLESYGAPTLAQGRVLHRVAPMTAGSVRFRYQSDDGISLVDCRADVIPHWTSENTWKVMVLSALRYERTLVAINDQPIAAVAEAGYRLQPASLLAEASHDLRVSLGVSFALGIK
jgi:hypothetical protein